MSGMLLSSTCSKCNIGHRSTFVEGGLSRLQQRIVRGVFLRADPNSQSSSDVVTTCPILLHSIPYRMLLKEEPAYNDIKLV